MAVLGTIVEPFVRPVVEPGHELAFGRTIGLELVRDDPLGSRSLAFHQLAQRSFVAPGLEDFVQNSAMLINGASEPECPAGNLHHDFVKVPDVTGAALATPQFPHDLQPELGRPTPNGFKGNVDATFSSISSTSRRLRLNRTYS